MASPLGKLTAVLGIDAREFTSGIGSAQKSMTGFGAGTKVAFAAVAGAAALGFGAMTKGALESEAAQGKFRAATGASADEAKAFVKDMDSLVGSNNAVGKSFEEIAAAGTTVAQQFGLSGQAAADMTDSFLGFAKVTGQDATGAVNSFDSALDAFGLPAERATSLMDQLVVSNQKYGTDAGPAALDALAKMAPALNAMNLSMDDGVGLLNLFENAGIDAANGQKLLNTALEALPDGQNINDVVKQLGAIEDPAERAATATELFGKNLGPKLANAIQPGMTSLSEFIPTVEEAAGASDRASDSMVTTADKIRSAFDKLGAGLRDLGTDFGPLLTGLGAVTTGLAPLGGKLVSALKLDDAFKAAFTAMKGKIGDLIGGLFGGGAEVLGEQLAKVGADAGVEIGQAIAEEAAPEFIEEFTTETSAKLGAELVAPEVLSGAKAGGTAYGKAFALGFAAGIVVVPLLQDVANKIHDTLFNSFSAKDPVTDWFTSQKALIDARAAGEEVGDAVSEGVAKVDFIGPLTDAQLDALPPVTAAAEEVGEKVAQHFTQRVGDGIDEGLANLNIAPFSETRAYAELIADAGELGASIPGQIGSSIQSHANEVLDGVASLRDLLENGLSPRARALQLIGSDYISLIRQGMDSNIDGAVESARSVAAAAINTLEEGGLNGVNGEKSLRQVGKLFDELIGSGMSGEAALELLRTAGVTADSAVLEGVRSKYPQFFNTGEGAAQKTISGWKNGKWYDAGFTATSNIREGIKAYSWYTGGWNTAKAWIGGFADKFDAFNWANLINSTVGPYTSGQSPPKKGPLHYIDKWGFNVGKAWVEGFGGALGTIGGVMPRGGLAFATARVGSLGVSAPGLAVAGGAGGVHVTVHIDHFFGRDDEYAQLGRRIASALKQQTR